MGEGPDGPDEPHPVAIKMIPMMIKNISFGLNMRFSPYRSAHKFVRYEKPCHCLWQEVKNYFVWKSSPMSVVKVHASEVVTKRSVPDWGIAIHPFHLTLKTAAERMLSSATLFKYGILSIWEMAGVPSQLGLVGDWCNSALVIPICSDMRKLFFSSKFFPLDIVSWVRTRVHSVVRSENRYSGDIRVQEYGSS